MSLATQFTEDIFATEDSVCQSTRCQASILRGQPRHYVRSIDDTCPGKYYCETCFKHIQNSLSTVRVPAFPDAESIRQSISAAQSRATVNPPPVMAMGHLSTMRPGTGMPPPPFPPTPSLHRPPSFQPPNPGHMPSLSTGRPDVHIPSAGNSRRTLTSLPAPASLPPPSRPIGYGPQHAHYPDQYRHWANHSRIPPAETYSLQISAMHECGGIKKGLRGNAIGSICEGLKGIDAFSTPPELITTALDAVTPRILAHKPQFPWRVDEFTVRDAKWVDLSKQSPTVAYFYEECLQPSNRKSSKGNLVFKKDKQFSLFVVVPEAQWEEFQEFKDKLDSPAPAPTGSLAIRHRQRLHVQSTSTSTGSSTPAQSVSTSNPKPQHPPPTPTSSTSTRRLFCTDPSATSSAKTVPAMEQLPRSVPQTTSSSLSIVSNFNYMSATKRHHRHSSDASSMSESIPHSPVLKKHANAETFVSIDRNQLKEALVSGGSADININDVLTQKVEHVDFFPIPTRPLNKLRERPCFRITQSGSEATPDNDVDAAAQVFGGILRINMATKEILGVGAFKTTQSAQLTVYPLREIGIGSRAKHDIVVKRPYIRQDGEVPKVPFSCPTFSDESTILYHEANIFYWAKALLKHTYDYIDSHIRIAPNPPPFNIPRLRFVDAGILLAYSERTLAATTLTRGGTASAMYLAEELIPLPADEAFVKYIHNGDATPRMLYDTAADEIAEFLAFTQHVQYITSEKLTYISDYQGHGLLLTDPQILTHPDLGNNLFGEGNIEFGVMLFETQHICNKYCKWPGFGLDRF